MSLRSFVNDTQGAVTTDWVVLAASVVGIGLSSVTLVRSGSLSMAADIEVALSQASVAAICQDSYAMRVFTGEQASKAEDIAREISQQGDDQLQDSHREVAAKVEYLIANGADQAGIDENMDFLALYEAEVARRGLRTDERTPTLNSLAGVTAACGDNTGAVGAGQHELVYYSDPRLEEDRRAYVEEFARLDRDQLGEYIRKIDDEFHNALANGQREDAAKLLDLSWMIYEAALANGTPEQITDARNRYDRALVTWQEARL